MARSPNRLSTRTHKESRSVADPEECGGDKYIKRGGESQ